MTNDRDACCLAKVEDGRRSGLMRLKSHEGRRK